MMATELILLMSLEIIVLVADESECRERNVGGWTGNKDGD